MVRKLWAGALAGALACTAPSWGQAPKAAPAAKVMAPAAKADERIITVKEAGKPEQKCRVLRCWTQKDGCRVCEVQDVATGEKLTLLEEVAGTNKKSLAQIFRWGKSTTPPAGAPVAPKGATVVMPHTPPRQSLLGRMFGSERKTETVVTTTTTVTPTNPRESWGKLERWKAADSDKAVQAAALRADAASTRPVATKVSHDPLMQPEKFTAVAPASGQVVTTEVGGTIAPVPVSEVHEGKPVVTARPNLLDRLRARSVKAPVVEGATPAPGMGSVLAASSRRMEREMDMVMTIGKDGQPVMVPRSEAPPKMVAVDVSAPNAFSTAMPVRQPVMPPMNMPMPPMMMAGGGMMMMPGMSMAPSYPGMTAGQPAMHPAMMHPAMMPVAPAAYPAADAEAVYTAQMVQQLREAELPSQREMAADHLSRVNWKAEPAAVQALLQAAKADPAPMVRAGCVQALAKMKVNTVPVVQAVSSCKQDSDSRVRQAAEHALSVLMAEK